MEEENRKGPGVFYAVVGVATLVVAIIGATFAYFSASATPTGGDEISGQTNNITATDLHVSVTKVAFDGATAASPNLVPAVITDSTTAGVTAALTAKCENAGYTGCHVYDIAISSDQTIAEADLLLDLAVTATTKTNWKYLVYQGSTSSADSFAKTATSLSTDAEDVELHERNKPTSTVGLTAGTPVHYYLMVYLANVESSQNGVGDGSTVETGSYSGSVELRAMGGTVKATFSAN